MIATAITATFHVPTEFTEGLANGTLERIGGVIREASNKKVVAWLREIPDSNLRPVLVKHLLQINTATSALTLGTTVAGFAVINQRLNDIDWRLRDMQKTLNKIDQKIDLQAYAKFRGALDLAKKAFAMSDEQNRRDVAIQVLKSFSESEYTYVRYLSEALQNEERAIHEYLTILALIYLTETRCYLELEEYTMALERLQEGCSKLRKFTKAYIEILFTSNPAAYITPFLKEEISLTRLTRIYRWLDPALQEADVFEKLRLHLFQWHKDASMLSKFRWLKELTPAILTQAEFKKQGPFSGGEQVEEVLACLPRYLEIMESAIETHNRLQGYQTEVQAMESLGLSFQDWLNLKPQEEQPENAQMMCLMAA